MLRIGQVGNNSAWAANTADDFVAGLTKAYPGLPGAEGLNEFAAALYK